MAFSLPSAGLDEEQASSFEDVANPPLCQGLARRLEESHGLAVALVSLSPIHSKPSILAHGGGFELDDL